MTEIKAAVCRAFGEPLSIETVTLADPKAGQIQVKLAACAICYSDISFIDGGWGGDLPAVYGHEAAGTVTSVGEGVTDFKAGDTVLVTLIKSCGSCHSCATAHPSLCTNQGSRMNGILSGDGGGMEQGLMTGAFAEAVVVDQSQVVHIPADIPMDSASLLSCGVITGVGAVVNSAGLRPGQNAVVIGAGGVGLNAIQGARIAGAAHVVAVDMTQDKLDAATEFGATGGVLATDPKPWAKARDMMGRGADAVFIAVGAIKAFDTATRYLDYSGKVYMVGMPHSGDVSSYEPVVVAAMGQGMVGTKMGDVVLRRDIPWMVDLYKQNRLKLDELISARWSLDQINEAIADTKSGAARRNVIVFD